MARAGLVATIAFAVLMALAGPALAEFRLEEPTRFELSTTQAGAHADLATTLTIADEDGDGLPDAPLRDARVSLPAGFWGAPAAFPACTERELLFSSVGACPKAAAVGEMSVTFALAPSGMAMTFAQPLFNLRRSDDSAAELGAFVGALKAQLRVKVRSDDYGLDTVSLSIQDTLLQVRAVKVTLWGVPADHNGSGAARVPFMTNPASCDRVLTGTIAVDSWDAAGTWSSAAAPVVAAGAPDDAPATALTGCDRLPPLSPQAKANPIGPAADAPSGYDIDVAVPQSDGPDGLSMPTVKAVAVAFPVGVAISPAAADGLQACSDADLAAGTDAPVACPKASKVGAVTIDTPALDVPLHGAMYLGAPQPGARYRLFLVADGPGVHLKLRGEAVPDPATGQLTTTFRDTPPLPWSRLRVQLKGGSRALLANPVGCGTYTSTVTLTPYGGGAPATASSPFTISADGAGGSCPERRPFAPKLDAGVTSAVAGARSPFVFRLTRADGQRELGAITSVKLPPGLLADVGSVPLCSAGDAAAAACPAATRVGGAQVAAGAGAEPLHLPGDVFLTGPYKGAPFGLSIVVRAVAGPYDLGTVNVRAAVKVNPDASLTVEADRLPTILEGIPLRLRDIVLVFDRAGFMLNPTSCAPATITASATSIDELAATASNRFQVGDCAALGYRPALSLELGGREKSGSTTLSARLTTRGGDANSKRIAVQLPERLGLNVKSGAALCSSTQLAARACPAGSVVGSASVDSILHEPLSGPVYFVEGAGGRAGNLPRLWIPLTGEGVTIDLMAQTTLEENRIVATFAPIPDVPFTQFDLKIDGGRKGILSLERSWCSKTLTAPVEMDAYNGKWADATVVVPAGCPLGVVSRSMTGSRLAVKVSGLGAGTLRLRGAGIRTVRKAIRSATVATITAARTRRSAPAGVTVTFDPAGAAKAKTLRVKLPKGR